MDDAGNVTLGPNESVAVGLTVDTTGGVAGIDSDEFTVHARVAEPEEAVDHDTATGGPAVSEAGGGVETPAALEFEVIEATLLRDRISPGDAATVRVRVENRGTVVGTTDLSLTMEGERVQSRAVELEPGETTEVTFETSPPEPGEYTIAVENVTAGRLVVKESATPTQPTAGGASAMGNGSTTEASVGTSPSGVAEQPDVEAGGGRLPALLAVFLLVAAVGGALALVR